MTSFVLFCRFIVASLFRLLVMCNVDNDYEWKTVPYKSKRRFRPATSSVTSPDADVDVISVDELENRLKKTIAELERSGFYASCLYLLKPVLLRVEELLCYGLGSPSASPASIQQLALLLLIKRSLSCFVYDPVFSKTDLQLFKRIGVEVIEGDERCCRELESNTLLYMVHCDVWMYNNILWANWSAEGLRKMVIVGNSFNSIRERIPSRCLRAAYEYVYLAGEWGIFNEVALPPWKERGAIFNDTSIVTFAPSLGRRFVRSGSPPRYDNV